LYNRSLEILLMETDKQNANVPEIIKILFPDFLFWCYKYRLFKFISNSNKIEFHKKINFI